MVCCWNSTTIFVVVTDAAIVTVCRILHDMQVYCDKTTEARITRFLLKVAKCEKFNDEIHRGASTGGLKLVVNFIRVAKSLKRCKRDTRSQFNPNGKSWAVDL